MSSLRLRARRVRSLGALLACSLLSATITGQAAAATSYSLAASAQPDRSSAVSLAGKTYAQPAGIYVFVKPAAGARRVSFYLDDATMRNGARSVDSRAPFDFAGTAADGSAIALDVGTLSPGSHTITAAIETTGEANVLTASFTVTAPLAPTPPPPAPPPQPPPPAGTSPAPFPSQLKASGRSIVDENGYVLPTLRGFNMHVGPTFVWSQSHFDAIRGLGGKITRAVLHWDALEPTRGSIDAALIANLDLHVARAQAAGMYTLLELHLNVGRTPSWASDQPTELERYATYGQTLTQYLAYRYGNALSPMYTKAVIGFGLNEPPLQDSTIRNGNDSIPYLEGKQRQMISWMREPGYAANWIGFVAYGYASATPIYDDTQNPNAVDASPTAYDAVGGNVVIDVHDYMAHCTNDDPDCQGRQWNGMSHPTYQGGALLNTGEASSYETSTIHQSQQAAFLKPYRTFSAQAAIPLMLGEWGWPEGPAGEAEWMADKKAAWTNAGTVIEIQWNYDVSSTNSKWAARPGGAWRASTLGLFAAMPGT